jgi:hypothetical protein
MTILYIMKCNKKPYHKVGVAKDVHNRRYDIETSIQKEYGLDHRLKVLHTIEIDDTHDAYTIEWQIQYYLAKLGYQVRWQGLGDYKSNGGSEWFKVKGGLPTLKKYLALGFRHFKKSPAPMPASWLRKKDGSIFKNPKPLKSRA